MKCSKIIKVLEELAPLKYAENWDNAGLLVGRREKEVHRIMVALDATEEVIKQAIAKRIDLLITHHPMLFSAIKKVTNDDFIGRKVVNLLQNDISYYAMHTNLDIMGMADRAAEMIGLENVKILQTTTTEVLYKLAVFVPVDNAEKVRNAMLKEGAGHIGAYSYCTFNSDGYGTYKPLDGTNPYIGRTGEVTHTRETKIETIIKKEKLERVIEVMLRAHPYEEVAYDIYELYNEGNKNGIGRVGYLKEDISLGECAKLVKESFNLEHVIISGDKEKKVAKVAISTGSGKSMVKYALNEKADVLITGDIDHHTALDAKEQGLQIIDAGHFGTEYFMVDFITYYLTNYVYGDLFEAGESIYNIEIMKAVEKNPFCII